MKTPFKAPMVLLGLAALVSLSVAAVASGVRINVSDSLPGWVYVTQPIDRAQRGDYVSFCPPVDVGSLPRGNCAVGSMALIKRVVAAEGDVVRFAPGLIEVNDEQSFEVPMAAVDSRGRALPQAAPGVQVLDAGQVVVLGDHERSLDSRYFGVLGGVRHE